ncbi:MAG TPA: DsbA family oxidoreductase [Ilumatobacter sp.]|nr:DsbA family oxidoreductase [Ilumatobacter sp.]
MSAVPVQVDIWSDIVCPWCYIGKRKFEDALHQLGDEFPVEVRYHAYQLDPTAPPGSAMPVPDMYAKKFGGADVARQMIERVTGVAAEVGLEFHLDVAVRANTLLAHRLLWLAAQPESPVPQAALNDRLMRAYFSEGRNVGDPDTLAELAADVGFDEEQVRGWLATDAGAAEVAAEIEQATEYGITAVPTFVVNEQWAIPGAQDADTFVTALRRIHEKLATGAV